MKTHSPKPAKQRGMAIISALLIAAVVAVIAGGMLTRQTLFTRTLEAEQLRIQGHWQLQGSLELSRQLLWEARQHEVLTRLDQAWAQPLGAIQTNNLGGIFEGRLEDEQGKFNLRNLVIDQQPDATQLQNFQRLCALLGIDASLGRRISQRVIASYDLQPERLAPVPVKNGFDSGRETSPGSAARLMPARQPMLRSLDDLRGLEGLDERRLKQLAAYISLLPSNTWVNGNTASAEVLSAVVPGLGLPQARALVAERDGGRWFINRGDFFNRLRVQGLALDQVQVGITSEWFQLHGQVRREQRRLHLQALLHRPEDRLPQVIWSRVGA